MQQLYKAEAGGHGSKQRQHGRAGRDTVVLVPVGTMVSRLRPLHLAEDEAAAHQPSGNNSSGGNEGITGGKRGAGAVGASSSFGVASSLSTGAQQRQPGTGTGRHRPRMHLLSRKRPREAAAGAGGSVDDADVDSGEQLRRASEEELPDWIKRLRQPWVGARDYRSDDEEEEEGSSSLEGEQGEEEEEGREGGSRREGGRGGGQSQQVLADLVQDGQEVRWPAGRACLFGLPCLWGCVPWLALVAWLGGTPGGDLWGSLYCCVHEVNAQTLPVHTLCRWYCCHKPSRSGPLGAGLLQVVVATGGLGGRGNAAFHARPNR